MRPLSFDPQAIHKHLLRHKIATLPELKDALGTSADLTVFRKLKLLDYLSSYTHRGRYYALRETARFDDVGLWSHDAVWFSRYGTLVSTIESFVNHSPRGWFANELADTSATLGGGGTLSVHLRRWPASSGSTPHQTNLPGRSFGGGCFRSPGIS
jgi:hypothetical protein